MTQYTARPAAPQPMTSRVLNPEGHGAVDLSADFDTKYVGIVALEAADAHVEGDDMAYVENDDATDRIHVKGDATVYSEEDRCSARCGHRVTL